MFFVCWFSMLLSQPLWRISSRHRNYKQLKSSNKSTTKTKQKATSFLKVSPSFIYVPMQWQYTKQNENRKKIKENGPPNVNERLYWWFYTHGQNTVNENGQGWSFFFLVVGPWAGPWYAMRSKAFIFRVLVVCKWELNTHWVVSKHRLKLGWKGDILTNYSICWVKNNQRKNIV